jgi:hypothetical protein
MFPMVLCSIIGADKATAPAAWTKSAVACTIFFLPREPPAKKLSVGMAFKRLEVANT